MRDETLKVPLGHRATTMSLSDLNIMEQAASAPTLIFTQQMELVGLEIEWEFPELNRKIGKVLYLLGPC